MKIGRRSRGVWLDMGQTAVRGARIAQGFLRPYPVEVFAQKIERVAASDPFDAPSNAQMQAIGVLMAQGKIQTGDAISLALPGYLASIQKITLPFRGEKKLRQALAYEMEERIPFALDEVALDFQQMGRRANGASDLLVCAAPKITLERYRSAFTSVGLAVTHIGLDATARYHAFLHAGGAFSGDVFLIEMGAAKTLFCHLRDGQIFDVRCLPIGADRVTSALQQEAHPIWSEAERAKRDANLAESDSTSETVRQSLLPWVLEVEKGMALAPPSAQQAFCLCGGGAKVKGLATWLASRWGMPHVPWPAATDSVETSAMGVGGIQFLREEGDTEPAFTPARQIAAGLALLVVVALLATHFSLLHSQREARYQAVKKELAQQFASLFPGVKTAGSEVDYLRAATASLERTASDLALGRVGALGLWKTLATRIPQTLPMEVQEMVVEAGKIHLEARTDSYLSVDRIREALLKDAHFREVTVSDAKASADNTKVGFRLQITLAQTEGT